MLLNPEILMSTNPLKTLLDSKPSPTALRAWAAQQNPEALTKAVIGLRGASVRTLFESLDDQVPARVEDFAPSKPHATVIYEGRNSMPLFSRFQKRFAFRVATSTTGPRELIGYNHHTWSALTGPGCYIVRGPSADEPFPQCSFFDYRVSNLAPTPAGWPAFQPNDRGFSQLVYGGMVDYVRALSPLAVAGIAYVKGKPQGAHFVLVRGPELAG